MTGDALRQMLSERLDGIRHRIAEACSRSARSTAEVTLIAVTKTVSIDVARAAFELGLKHLAESRPQELWKKQGAIPEASWHLVGHLQRNKLERTAPLVALIHSVDSLRLLESLDAHGLGTQVLLEVNCSRESNKSGFSAEEVPLLAEKLTALKGVRVDGLMTMAAHYGNPELCRPSFAELRTLQEALRSRTGLAFPNLSMGMSSDFEIAIEEGATMIRLGTVLFDGLGQ